MAPGRHTRWAGPQFEGHIPSIGYDVIAGIEQYMCHGEGDLQGQPATIDAELADHIVECYRIDPVTGRRVYSEVMLSRPKGRNKSECAAWVATTEGFLPCRFDGWDAYGQPVARPVRTPLVKCLATEEGQAGNTFKTVAFIAGEWGMDNHPEIYLGAGGVRRYQSASAIYLPHGGDIRASTSGSASKDGGLETHVVADEVHLYVLRELREMYATIARNLGKRYDADPWIHSTTTMYRAGEQSIAEQIITAWRKNELGPETYVNHRQASGRVNLADVEHTKAQLREVYGAAAEWIDLDRKIRDMRNPRICKDEAEAARYFLNRSLPSKDAWIGQAVVEERVRPRHVDIREPITVGFDGSLNEDTTVLRGCCLSDGYRFRLGAWEKPDGPDGIGWEVPRREVLATIREVYRDRVVARGYFDPHEWRSDIDALAEEFGDTVIKWDTHRDVAMAGALDRLHADLMNGATFSDADPVAIDHYGNAYVRWRGKLRLVRKEYPNSPRKIDTVVGDALAYEARADALASGWSNEPQDTRIIVFR